MYNMNFELCALIILVLVLLHVRITNVVQTVSNRVFLLFASCGVANIALDLITTVMIYRTDVYPVWATNLALVALYMLQLIVPFMMVMYVFTLRNHLRPENKRELLIASIPFLVMSVLVLTNTWTGIFFYFENGVYMRGPLYLVMYMHALYYMVVGLVDANRHKNRIPRRFYLVVWEYVGITAALVFLQMLYNDILLTGVGIAASLIAIALTVNNPMRQIDSLTGLFDETALRSTLDEINRKRVTCYPIALALDNLKRLNLVFGIENANKLLCDLADQFLELTGPNNTYRFLGDQFVLLCHSEKEYRDTLQTLRKMFHAPRNICDTQVYLSACICGIPQPLAWGSSKETLDFIAYMIGQAKKSGPGTVLESNESIAKEYRRRKEIESFLYTAVEQNLFEVYYQPVFCVSRGCYTSAEALVRLNHPVLGTISPGEFIPIAESSGEISRVERCIFHKICDFLRSHPEALDTLDSIKVNLSPATFLSATLSTYLISTMEQYGIEPHRIQFEITETAATVYSAETAQWAREMLSHGINLCLDDFGSGYANLGAVMKLPFKTIKLDRSLLVAAQQDMRSSVWYANIVHLLQALGFEVVAEGAETQSDVDYLTQNEVDYIQGFHYSRPLPEAKLLALLESCPTAMPLAQ